MAGPTTNGTVRWRRYALSGGVLGVALLLWALSFRGAQVQILNIQPEGASNQFRLTWSSTPEKTYQLQRTDTLPVNNPTGWVPVLTLQATSTVTVARDVAGVSAKQRFYRVAELTGAGLTNQPPLTVSPVQAAPGSGGASSGPFLQVVTGGTQTINSVTFLDNGVLLGAGQLGLGSAWTLTLPSIGGNLQIRRITARVITQEGTTNSTPTNAFLQADAARFVPINTDGSRGYGQFVSADSAGNLAPFLFFPEGLGDGATVSGAHFEFPSGASLQTQGGATQIQFGAGKFHRGNRDTSPVIATGGTHSLNIASITPASVVAALGQPGNTSLQLLWGSIPVPWLNGALSSGGWSALSVRPPIGNFLLPTNLGCSQVTFDPKSGEPTLIVCYYGDWAPFADGPQFRIPSAEPVKIYLSLSGKISAYGTVVATFSSGAMVRGSLSWREPNFEVRFQGRNIVIPALSSLQRALPASPGQCIPTNSTTAALDLAASCLTSFRDTYRALAMGGLAEASTNGSATQAPLGQPTDSAGTALRGWTSRIASWAADRSGQALDSQMVIDLGKVIGNAAKTGEAAHDLATVLQLLRDVLITSANLASATANGSDRSTLQAQLDDAQARLFAAAERVVGETEAFEPSAEFSDIVTLLSQTAAAANPTNQAALASSRVKARDATSSLQDLQALVRANLGPLFIRQVFNAAANAGLDTLSSSQLLQFLGDLVDYSTLLKNSGTTTTTGIPTAQDVANAASNADAHFAIQSDADATEAITPPDYLKLRDVLNARGRFFELNDALGIKMASDQGGFSVATPDLIEPFIEGFNALPFSNKPTACRRDLQFLSQITEHTTDKGAAVSIADGLALIAGCDAATESALASSSESSLCDELALALTANNFTIAPRDPLQEGNAFPDITGKYESVEDGTETYATLQLNQGGRYLEGGMQLQVEKKQGANANASYLTRKLDGMFLRQTSIPGTMEFAVRSVNDADGSTQFLDGTARQDNNGNTTLTLGPVHFTQVSRNGRFSDAILEAFEPGQRGPLKASQETPMHSRIIARTTTDAASLKLSLDKYFSAPANSSDEQAAVGELQGKLQRIDQRLTGAQRPIGGALMRRILSTVQPSTVPKSKVTGNATDLGNQTLRYWDQLLAVALRQNLNVSAQLGVTPAQLQQLQASIGQDSFHYEMIITNSSVSAGEGPIGFGAGRLNVTVNKYAPGGQLQSTFHLAGTLDSYSPAVGPLPAACNYTISTNSFDSPLNFSAADFAGPFEFAFFSVNAAVPLPANTDSFLNVLDVVRNLAGLPADANTWAIGYFEVDGSGRFPAMTFITLPQDGFAANQCFNVGIGIDVGGGSLRTPVVNEPESLLFDPGEFADFDLTNRAHLEGGVYFEINGSTLTDCGWQYLREFVAENHELLIGTKSEITVKGYTDAPGSGSFNQALSEARANSVKQALTSLLGPSLRTTITATGFGEADADHALGIGPEDPATNDPLFRRADIIVGGVVIGTIGAPVTPHP